MTAATIIIYRKEGRERHFWFPVASVREGEILSFSVQWPPAPFVRKKQQQRARQCELSTMSSFRKKSLRRKDVNLQVAVDQRERESIVAEAGRHSERARVSFGGHEGRGKTAPVMRFWLRKRPQLLHFTLSHPPPPPTAFPRHFEADLPPPPPPG